jgi:predicted DCC family thiol-disulfide oxidoreductase YuxK
MNHYKKLAAKEDAKIDWVDISKSRLELKAEGIKYADAMRVIHIKDDSGVHRVGVEAIFTLWDRLPYYRQLSRVLKRSVFLHPMLDKAYAFFARHRMKIPGRLKTRIDSGAQQ